jgi:hypothetical protein
MPTWLACVHLHNSACDVSLILYKLYRQVKLLHMWRGIDASSQRHHAYLAGLCSAQ